MRVSPDEYAPFYETYVRLVKDLHPLEVLEQSVQEVVQLIHGLGEEGALHRYAPGKWSVKELLGHIVDTERIMSYRLLRIARGDQTPLAGYEEDDYVRSAAFDDRPLTDLLEEYSAVRRSSVALLKSLGEEALLRRGTANGHPCSARAIAYIMAGHERHHVGVLRERYLS
ncbi:DinB family protein [Paenibacillus sp. GCM10023252]|uniref:DinB family protein n=1 Tax=Paenibacillus sp. GCM10023252 TaxID=3252649 RepID=UPI0036224942